MCISSASSLSCLLLDICACTGVLTSHVLQFTTFSDISYPKDQRRTLKIGDWRHTVSISCEIQAVGNQQHDELAR
ncbi:hypothetical protein FB451DRAFT_1214661 [Mycena latifolia]|nr:hypothetical protein FB451DRAFT_1214661 [Mycena latifolia]